MWYNVDHQSDIDQAGLERILTRHLPGLQAAWLFGSHGTEFQRADSDVDLADSDVDLAVLLPQGQPDRQAWQELVLDLQQCFGRSVDLVNLGRVNMVLRMQVLEHGRLLVSRDETARQHFEMLTMSLYQKLQEERAEILQDILRTRRIVQ